MSFRLLATAICLVAHAAEDPKLQFQASSQAEAFSKQLHKPPGYQKAHGYPPNWKPSGDPVAVTKRRRTNSGLGAKSAAVKKVIKAAKAAGVSSS